MTETYLIFERYIHTVVHFVQASSSNKAIWQYISEQNDNAILQEDGSVRVNRFLYPHSLAYIEARYKIHGEWQIRKMPSWVWQEQITEVFCGESEDGPASVISDCRERFIQVFPRSRAKAFVWYLKRGTLVTFYRKQGAYKITVLKRYLWDWDGHRLAVENWEGSYEQILEDLLLEPSRPKTIIESQKTI